MKTVNSKTNQKVADITKRIIENIQNSNYKASEFAFRTMNNYIVSAMNYEGKRYQGLNVILLNDRERMPFWVTYRQAQLHKTYIKKGAIARKILYIQPIYEDEEKKEIIKSVVFKSFSVFNIEDVNDPTKFKVYDQFKMNMVSDPIKKIPSCENLVKSLDMNITHTIQKQPRYLPLIDKIEMPFIELYKSTDIYYNHLFHEIGHATSHQSRCNRDLGKINYLDPHNDENYIKEEFVAETVSSFMTDLFKMDCMNENTVYIKHYIERLKEDKYRQFLSTVNKSIKAIDYILQKSNFQYWRPE